MISDSSRNRSRRRRGFSLLEFAIALAVVGIVAAALWGVVGIVREQSRRGQLADEIFTVVTNVRSFYGTKSRVETPAGVITFSPVTDYLLRQGVIPPEMNRNRTLVTWVADLPWGQTDAAGSFRVSGDNVAGGDISTRSFRIEVLGLNFSNCVGLVTKMATAPLSGLEVITINAPPAAVLNPWTAEAASALCINNTASVSFQYRLRDRQM